jgi:hypothetical protein
MGLGLRLRDRLNIKMGLKDGLRQDVLDVRSSSGVAGPTLVSLSNSPSPGIYLK